MVLVGKRHWSGGKDGNQRFLHYLVRVICFAGIVIAGSLSSETMTGFVRMQAKDKLAPYRQRLGR